MNWVLRKKKKKDNFMPNVVRGAKGLNFPLILSINIYWYYVLHFTTMYMEY